MTHPIVDSVARMRGLPAEAVTGRHRTAAISAAYHEAAFRLWTETDLSTGEVARRLGRRDHGTAIAAILAGARARGIVVSTVSELRGASTGLDWTKFAFAVAGWREKTGATLEEAARRARVGRVEWRKAEQGRSVSAATLIRICHAYAIDPFSLLTGDDA